MDASGSLAFQSSNRLEQSASDPRRLGDRVRCQSDDDTTPLV